MGTGPFGTGFSRGSSPWLWLLALSLLPHIAHGDPLGSKPPPGFEALLEPQTTLFDVYYGGLFLTASEVTFTPESVTFTHPEEIVTLLPDLRESAAVLQALTGPLPTHGGLRCGRFPRPDCGVLRPEVAGVIADPDRFRIDLFVSPDFLAPAQRSDPRFLPPGESGFAFAQQLSASASGVSAEANNYNLIGGTTLSMGSTRAESLWSVSDSDGLTLETLTGIHIHRDRRWTAGMFRTAGMRMISEQDILGLGLSSTLLTRIDLDRSLGSQLQLFLPTRSQVDIFKDDRLLSSAFYEAGNQTLNTAALPEGAYQVLLRIREPGGVVREETRFFAKSMEMPPEDQPYYVAQLGYLQNPSSDGGLPNYSDVLLLRLGTAWRLTDTSSWDAGLLGGGGKWYAEGGLSLLTEQLRLRTGILGSSDSDLGLSVDSRFQRGRFGGGLSFIGIWEGEDQQSAETLFDPITASSRQLSASFSYSTARITYGLRANWNQLEGDYSTWSVTPRATWHIARVSGMQLDLELEYTQTDQGSEAWLMLNLFGSKGHWSGRGRLGYQSLRADQTEEPRFDVGRTVASGTLTWNDLDLLDDQLAVSLGAGHEIDRDRVSGDLDYRSDLGRMQLAAEHDRNRSGEKFSLYSANLSVTVVGNPEGVALGGEELNRSTIVVELTGDAKDARFDLLVDDQARATLTTPGRHVVNLPAFRTYSVRLLPKGAAFLGFDAQARKITLYPGNVATLKWSVSELRVLFARLLQPDGSPVARARVEGVESYAVTELDGSLQAEIKSETRSLRLQPPNRSPCQVELPELAPQQGVLFFGDLICR